MPKAGVHEARFLRLLVPALVACAVLVLVGGMGPGGYGLAVVAAAASAVALARRTAGREARIEDWLGRVRRGERAAVPLAVGLPDRLDRIAAEFGEIAASRAGENASLREERDRLEATLGAMVEGVVAIDAAGHVLRANDRAREMLGTALGDDLEGRLWVDFNRDPELAAFVRQALAGGVRCSREIEMRGAVDRVLDANAGPTADGRFWVLVFHDVTETRRLERIRTDFVANVSHELRTPLTAIKGFAETLRSSGFEDRATAARYVDVIDRHAGRLGRLIDDLLTLGDLELGRKPLVREDVAVASVARDAVELLEESARRAGVSIVVDVAEDTKVSCDADRLQQVLSNLLDNAIKYAPGGHVRITTSGPAEGKVEIAVADDGRGIPSADLPRLTERFYRVDKSRGRDQGGTGLGLAIVKHIAQAHGGEIAIDSRPGAGTTVRVTLPAASGVEGAGARQRPAAGHPAA
ncbi:PAS domain-containing protein [bacterium]|nr:PAS domain-containing protein [bacterium]